jgi:MFS family permease
VIYPHAAGGGDQGGGDSGERVGDGHAALGGQARPFHVGEPAREVVPGDRALLAALTIAGLVGLLASMPMGRLADRRGPRGVLGLSLVVLAGAAAGYVFLAHGFRQLLARGDRGWVGAELVDDG